MGKLTLSLLISILFVLPPVSVKAQSFGARGFSSKGVSSGFGANRGFSARGSVSSFGRGLGAQGVNSSFRSTSAGNSIGRGSFRSGFRERNFNPGFYSTKNRFISSTSNLIPSTLNTGTRRTKFHQNGNFFELGSNRSKTFGSHSTGLKRSTLFNSNTHVSMSRFSSSINSGERLIQSGEIGTKRFSSVSFTETDSLNPSVKRTPIVQWVDRNGVIHLTNKLSSVPGGKDVDIVTDERGVSTSEMFNMDTASENSRYLRNTMSSLQTVNPVTRRTHDHMHVGHNSGIHKNSTKIFFNFFSGSPFFVSPFAFSPALRFSPVTPFLIRGLGASPFFALHPFAASPFFTFPIHPLIHLPLFDQFVFQPLFFSPFFNSFPFGCIVGVDNNSTFVIDSDF